MIGDMYKFTAQHVYSSPKAINPKMNQTFLPLASQLSTFLALPGDLVIVRFLFKMELLAQVFNRLRRPSFAGAVRSVESSRARWDPWSVRDKAEVSALPLKLLMLGELCSVDTPSSLSWYDRVPFAFFDVSPALVLEGISMESESGRPPKAESSTVLTVSDFDVLDWADSFSCPEVGKTVSKPPVGVLLSGSTSSRYISTIAFET